MDDDRPVDGEPEEELTPDSTPIGQPIPDAEPSTAKNEGPATRSAEAREVFRQKAMGKVEKALGQKAMGKVEKALGEKFIKSLFGRFVKGTVAGAIGGPIGWAYDLWLILDLIKDPQTRKMGCVSLALFFFILLSIFGIIAMVALAILGAGNEDGQWGITQTQTMSATNSADMTNLKLIACLDDNKDESGTITKQCKDLVDEELVKVDKELDRYGKLFEQSDDDALKASASKEIAAAKGLIAQMKTTMKLTELQAQRAEFGKRVEALRALMSKLGFMIDVPVINQPERKWCGYTSVAMVASYYHRLNGGTGLIAPKWEGHQGVQLNSHLNSIFNGGGPQYSEYTGNGSNEAYFNNIFHSLSMGAPVIIYTDFYGMHIFVLVGYDPSDQTFIAHDTNIPKTHAFTKEIQGVKLTKENLAARSNYPGSGGSGILYYAGNKPISQYGKGSQ